MPLAAAEMPSRTDLQNSHESMVNGKRQFVENKKGALLKKTRRARFFKRI
jgi:hypothetical protein